MDNLFIINLEKKAQEKYKEIENKVYELKLKLNLALDEKEEYINELAFLEFCIEYFEICLGFDNKDFKNYLSDIVYKIREIKYKEIKLEVIKDTYLSKPNASICKILKFKHK